MECKGEEKLFRLRVYGVLIETSWNVKTAFDVDKVMEQLVLIETSWNVKDYVIFGEWSGARSINRNIVECKGMFSRHTM